MLTALADNELHGPDAETLRQQINSDPARAARFAVFAESRAALQADFAAGETPAWMESSIRSAKSCDVSPPDKVVRFRLRTAITPSLALAASLLLAVGVGSFFAGRSVAPLPLTDPASLAAVALADLGTGAETAIPASEVARILGSYQTDQGLCRMLDLTLSDDRSERAVVCRAPDKRWMVMAAIAAGQSET